MGADSPWLQLRLPSASREPESRSRSAVPSCSPHSSPQLGWSGSGLTEMYVADTWMVNCMHTPSCNVISADGRLGNCNQFLAFIASSASLAGSCI